MSMCEICSLCARLAMREEFYTEEIREEWPMQKSRRRFLSKINKICTDNVESLSHSCALLSTLRSSRIPKSDESSIVCTLEFPLYSSRNRECIGRTQKATTRKRFYTSNSKNTIVAAAPSPLALSPRAFHAQWRVWFFFFKLTQPRCDGIFFGSRVSPENTRVAICGGKAWSRRRARPVLFSPDARDTPVKRKCWTTRWWCTAAWKTGADNNRDATESR